MLEFTGLSARVERTVYIERILEICRDQSSRID